MLEFSRRSNTLEQSEYKYSLQDIPEPHLYRTLFNYDEAPKIPFNHRHVPMRPPDEIWITDTTFRDGQQAARHTPCSRSWTFTGCCTGWAGPRASSGRASSSSTARRTRKRCTACLDLGYRLSRGDQLDPGQ